MVLIFGGLWDRVFINESQPRVDHLPKFGLGYAGLDLPLTPAEKSLYKQTYVIKRGYELGRSNRFVLIVVDGTRNRHAVHDPLYCFRGAGWGIDVNRILPIEGGKARFLKMSKSNKARETIYWFSDGRVRHASMGRYWFQTTLRRLTLGLSGQEPVMVILQPFGDDLFSWQKILKQFGPLTEL
jgi:hypothetical protein